jgi:putative thioredoxin
MSDNNIAAAAGRGAVDLSGISAPTSGAAPAGADAGRPRIPAGLVQDLTDANFNERLTATTRVAAVAVLWSARLPESRAGLEVIAEAAAALQGRLQVLSCDVDQSPTLFQAFRVQSVPTVVGLVQGQALPLFVGIPDDAQIRAALDQLVQFAVQNGVAGRAELGPTADDGEGEGEALSPHHEAAFDAIEAGDFDAATAAYERAIAEDPGDEDAKLGLAQVALLRRTQGVDLQAARAAAAAAPADIEAAFVVADLDLLGGHVEDAFARLLDLVRSTAGDDRARVKDRLVELLAVVGNADPRVKKARTALMSALF